MILAVKKTQQFCQEFWAAFCRLIGQEHPVYPRSGIWFLTDAKGPTLQQVSLKEPICLLDWPCEHGQSRTVDIVVNYEMTVITNPQIPSGRISGSKAQVFYFRGGIATSPHVEVFRFDYHPGTGLPAGDPIFHLQLNHSSPITDLLLPERLRQRWKYKRPQLSALNNYVRIPTPRMLLPDILCYLVADHLRSETCNVHKLVAKTQRAVAGLTGLISDTTIAEHRFWQFTAAAKWYRRGP